jgi:hypothetical protein
MSLAAHQFTVTDEDGNVVPSVHIEVRSEVPSQPLAAVYSDRAGTVALGNPFDTDASGFVRFFVVGGAYQIRAYTGPSGSPTFEAPLLRYVAIGRNAESDSITQRTQRVVTAAGTVTVDADDADIIYINKTVGAATAVTLPLSASRTTPIMIVDGKGDASTNNITISPQTGESIYAITNGSAIIDGNGGSVILTPKSDGTGWF